jgi:hypothetical protein
MPAFVDPRRALLALLNVRMDDREVSARAQDFIATYGPLREARVRLGDLMNGRPSMYTAEETVIYLAEMFSDAGALLDRDRPLNLLLANVFQEARIDGVFHKTALEVDIVQGTVEPKPRDLLDAMALALLRNRKMIARCDLCSKFFYKSFSRDRYCSPACTFEARRLGQLEWVRKKAAQNKQQSQRTKKTR